MAFSLTQLNALEAAIASGQLSVNYDGKSVTYRSVGELMQARDIVRSELIASGQLRASPLSNRGPASLATFSRD
ncbi:phage head-tail joining protein [Telluria sp. B2]